MQPRTAIMVPFAAHLNSAEHNLDWVQPLPTEQVQTKDSAHKASATVTPCPVGSTFDQLRERRAGIVILGTGAGDRLGYRSTDS